MLEVFVFGSGCALPQPGRGPAGYGFRIAGTRGVTLLDCGPGTVRALGDAGIDLLDVERVVVSHFHTDHILDLYALAFARRNPHLDGARLAPLTIIGPKGLAAVLALEPAALGLAATWRKAPRQSVVELEAGSEIRAGDLSLRCQSARHSPEALHWRVGHEGASLTFSGDTGEHPGLAELARDTDLLIAECAFGPSEEPDVHLNAAAAGRAARDAGAGHLLLTHFYPHVDPKEAVATAASLAHGPVWAATDGMRLQVETGSVRIETSA